LKFLCCDLGGTNAGWAVYDTIEADFVFRSQFRTADYEDFYEMMDHVLVSYRNQMGAKYGLIDHATFAVAGPTDHQKVSPTNIEGWEINVETANSILKDHDHSASSTIINDFEALGYGVLHLMQRGLTKEDYTPVYGRFRTGSARIGEEQVTTSVICGPGTGLGVACLVDGLYKNGFPYIISSEGGHHTLAPETPTQHRLLEVSGNFKGQQSYEDTLSHTGMRNMYNFFRKADYSAEPNYSIRSKEIIMLAASGKDQAATDAIELFCEILANFCGNLALTFNCNKAVFLWGGALETMPPDLLNTRFKRLYADRCNHGNRVAKVPVILLKNQDTPLIGCAHRSKFELDHSYKDK